MIRFLTSWSAVYLVDFLALLSFAVSYYRGCYAKGYSVDIWHSYIFLFCVLPNMLMLPFAAGEQNVVVLGRDYPDVAATVPLVFLITMLGYGAMLLGGSIWRFRSGLGLRNTAIEILDVFPNCSLMLMSSRSLLVLQAIICVGMQACILLLHFSQDGVDFDLRGYGFAHPTLRPIIQIIVFYSTMIASHCFARYLNRKEASLLACTLVLSLALVFFGSRAALLVIYLNAVICLLIRRGRRVSLLKLTLFSALVLVVAFYLGSVRAGSYSIGNFIAAALFLLLYGNNFSDLRDFAWVYSHWDHTFWLGKTYLAALTAFVPRFASSFRDTWGLGVATSGTVGLDTTVHPGLRPSAFGEGYFNFGVVGVLVVGILMGAILRRVDIDTKRIIKSKDASLEGAFASTMLINVATAVAISTVSSTLYVMAGVYFVTWILLRVLRDFTMPKRELSER